jgi:hypothetical protein
MAVLILKKKMLNELITIDTLLGTIYTCLAQHFTYVYNDMVKEFYRIMKK